MIQLTKKDIQKLWENKTKYPSKINDPFLSPITANIGKLVKPLVSKTCAMMINEYEAHTRLVRNHHQ
jgi:hypothetical protein